MLILVCGLPGTGKSFLARALAEEFSAVRISSDRIRKKIFKKPTYSEAEKQGVYEEMYKRTKELLQKEKNVVLDATFYLNKYRKMMEGLKEIKGSKIFVIKCIITEAEIKKRLEKRKEGGASMSDADYNIYRQLKKEFEPLEGDFLEIDCSLDKEEMLQRIRKFIGES